MAIIFLRIAYKTSPINPNVLILLILEVIN